ncbi:translation initiation factor eIF-2B subunit delta [Cyclospora cayetanensis]|uniref:Translation initiation factor eIF2B subunit delta n=1 Tax=Cyclospora cayetanensis TaxID=88456 RepID=A0A6P6RVR7_9EIME|nr:translation initiation factor eIF-2B subunit delta [Cyclospora cayetanensis]
MCSGPLASGTRPPRPGSTSSFKYERLPPHIRFLMNFRQESIHPAVLRAGLQMGQRKIVGSNARTAAMLTAFQRFIEDYSPPPYQAVDKHLKQMLDRQINFITHCRPHSIAMGGTIRWLKRKLSTYASLQLEETRARLSLDIANFIACRLLSATLMAASIVEQQLIEDGDSIMIFGRSTAVTCALLQSKKQGLHFSVVMVDVPHTGAGQEAAKAFADTGIYVTYTMLNGLSYHITSITKVLLGCSALLANGCVLNSAGAATVAMMGKMHAKPVIVVTETYKMSDRVMLDSCSFNELCDPALVWRPSTEELTGLPSQGVLRPASATASAAAEGLLDGVPVVNPAYDVTPAQFVDYVVTEDGMFPASSVPGLICGLGKSPALAD